MLGDWLEEFLSEFSDTMQIPPSNRVLEEAEETRSAFRPDPPASGGVEPAATTPSSTATRDGGGVEITIGRTDSGYRALSGSPDRGPGIASKRGGSHLRALLYGHKGGTGLGLFIARELCQLNRAVLLYEPRSGGGSVFRIVFSDPQRWEG